MQMSKLIIITGVPSAGKTTLSKEAIKNTDYEIINFGEIINELLVSHKVINNEDNVRSHIDQNIWEEYQVKAAKRIRQKQGNKIIITHASFLTSTGYSPGLPKNILQELQPSYIVNIESPLSHLLRRQQEENQRIIGIDFQNDIDNLQQINRMYSVTYSIETGARFKIIQNQDNHLDQAVSDLKRILVSFF